MQLQPRLKKFAEFLGQIVNPNKRAEATVTYELLVAETPKSDGAAYLGGPVMARIGKEVRFREGEMTAPFQSFIQADAIRSKEARFIHRRRQALGRENVSAGFEREVENATGLCLSGGGIRSATFSLGIVQVLASQGMLPQIDYLSTVSGGGYLGTFLTAFLGTPEQPAPAPASDGDAPKKPAPTAPAGQEGAPFKATQINDAIKATFDRTTGSESAAIRHLRNNSRYLASGGMWAVIKIIGLLVTGIVTNILLLLPVPLFGVLAILLMRWMGYWGPVTTPAFWMNVPTGWNAGMATNVCEWSASILAVLWVLLPLVRDIAHGNPPESKSQRFRVFWETLTLLAALVAVAAGMLLLLPNIFYALESAKRFAIGMLPQLANLLKPETLSAIGSIVTVVLGVFAERLKSGSAKNTASYLFILSGPFLYLLVFFFVTSRVFDATWGAWSAAWVCGATAVLSGWGWLLVNINDFSPHGYYRDRLCECYLAARGEDRTGFVARLVKKLLHGRNSGETKAQTGIGKLKQLPLSQMNATGAAPYHLINAAVNLPASHEPNLRGRDCDFYLFSKYYCGGPVCGYYETTDLEKFDNHVDLGSAMAISGAAASANMGVNTMRQYRFLLALLNIRLGYWLWNPLQGSSGVFRKPGPKYLIREMTGWMHEKTGFLNISDGGHIENLAFYEMLRRRCKFIIVVDGGMEPGMECADLMLAQRYAQIDLGVRFDLDITDLALNAKQRTRAYAVFGKIHYNMPEGSTAPEDLGWVIYVKLACTGGEPGYVSDYRRLHPDFPHQTTAQQLYDEAEFEAYRRLGECAGESLFRGELSGKPVNPAIESTSGEVAFNSLSEWFQALANNLLPDNDVAFINGPKGPPSTPGAKAPVEAGVSQGAPVAS